MNFIHIYISCQCHSNGLPIENATSIWYLHEIIRNGKRVFLRNVYKLVPLSSSMFYSRLPKSEHGTTLITNVCCGQS